jgi:hypothetical protein
MVIGHLNEENYMPKEKKPIISLKGFDIITEDHQSRFKDRLKKINIIGRAASMPSLKNSSNAASVQNRKNRRSVMHGEIPSLIKLRAVAENRKNLSKKNIFLNIASLEKKDKVVNILSPALSYKSLSKKSISPVKYSEESENRYTSVINKSHKIVAKAKFKEKFITDQHLLPDPPHIFNLTDQSNVESLTKMPKIVRRILEKKMNLDPSIIKSIED